MSKAVAERRHARSRARERYGIEVGRPTRERILAAIRAGRSGFVSASSLRVSIHDVELDDGLVVRVVYGRKRHELVTFLPRAS